MNTKRRYIAITLVLLIALSTGILAQRNRNRLCDPQQPNDCLTTPQLNAFRHGGMGFVNPDTGSQWNGESRGQMGRGSGIMGTGMYVGIPPKSDQLLPQDLVDLMLSGWLDEQQAYAVYESVLNTLGEINPFANIQQAELQHIAAWEFLFDRYDIDIPQIPGFDIPAFNTRSDACAFGAEAEIVNFSLYDTMIESFAEYPDIAFVVLSLRNASEFNHLPAFENCQN